MFRFVLIIFYSIEIFDICTVSVYMYGIEDVKLMYKKQKVNK